MGNEKINIEKLNRITGLQNQRRNIDGEIAVLSVPILTDVRKIKDIYQIFVSVIGHPPVEDERKAFVMIILYLYSPDSLIGKKIRKGVRREISALFLDKSPSWVSQSNSYLLFYYQTYKSFRCMVDEIFSKMMAKIS